MAQKSTRSNPGAQGEPDTRTITTEFKIVNTGGQHDPKCLTFLRHIKKWLKLNTYLVERIR